MHSPLVVLHVVALLCVGTATPAQAQFSRRPYNALFGGVANDPTARHTLDLTFSLSAQYDDNALDAADAGVADSLFYDTGFSTGFSTGLTYVWRAGESFQFSANSGTDARYFPEQSELKWVNQSFGVGFSASLPRRTQIFANQSVSYTPSSLYAVYAPLGPMDPGTIVGPGSPLTDDRVFIYDTSFSVRTGISRRGSVEGIGSFHLSDYRQGSERETADLRSYAIGARYRHATTRYVGLRLGYVYRSGTYGLGGVETASSGVHDIDVGVDYSRALSRTRRTNLEFSVGSSLFHTSATGPEDPELQYNVVGVATLSHQFGRTWSTRLGYNRGVSFAEGFARPVFSDAFSADLKGLLSRRLDFQAVTSVSIGDAGPASQGPDDSFTAFNANARLQYALASAWAVFVEFSHYQHALGQVLLVTEGVPADLDRNSVYAGVSLSLPLLKR
jgi:hypothetical protein